MDDPLIDEIREIRRKIFMEECGGDRKRLFAYYQLLDSLHPERVVGYDRPGKVFPPVSQADSQAEEQS